MALATGTHKAGPQTGTLEVHTFREGVAAKVGHDLIIVVTDWEATVDVGADGEIEAVMLRADPRSLEVREGLRGVKPLTDRDRGEIRKTIEAKILGADAIVFESGPVGAGGERATIEGQLTIAGATRPAAFELVLADDGRVTGKASVRQTEWGIKPYRGLMGALKVRDDVEVTVDARMTPASAG